MALEQYRAAYNDAVEALKLIDTDRYDFQPTGSKTAGNKLRYEQVAVAHDRAAQCLIALDVTNSEMTATGHWENALTMAAMGENNTLVDRYQNNLEVLGSSKKGVKNESSKDDEEEKPIVEEVDMPIQKTNTGSRPIASESSALSGSNSTQAPKYQYYQDSVWMKIQIIESKLSAETCFVSITEDSLSVSVLKNGTTYTVIHGDLYDKILVDRCRTLYKEDKVLIKLKKAEESEWHSLLDDKKKKKSLPKIEVTGGEENREEATKPKSMPRPYASEKDWDAIDRDLKQQEENEKPEGEEALNALFKQIYANANEDTRRAMVKSMQTSGGTVLSTNWNEVKQADYEKERVAPKGMEWKNYEGDKLKMKEDD